MRKSELQLGDVIHNWTTQEAGQIVRIYSDIAPVPGKPVKGLVYVVSLPSGVLWEGAEICMIQPAKEALWQESEVHDRPQAGRTSSRSGK
jgi:hypothetical protein